MLTNQKHSAALAGARTNASAAPKGPTSQLLDDISLTARCLLLSVTDASPSDRQFLYDVARQEARFPARGIARLIELSRRSMRASHREMMSEIIRKHSLPTDESLDVIGASIAETMAQGAGDVAVHVFLHERTERNRSAAVQALTEHFAATRRLLDVVKVTPVHA